MCLHECGIPQNVLKKRTKTKTLYYIYWHPIEMGYCETIFYTLVVVLAPHEYAAPVGEVIRNNGESIPPGFHHRLHVMEACVAAQVSRLKPCINLGRFLQLDNLLCRLWRDDSWKEKKTNYLYTQTV